MNSDQAPPYTPSPAAPGYPPGYSSQPAGFPVQQYQGFPGQSYPAFHAPVTQQAVGPCPPQAFQGYQSAPQGGPQYGWDGTKGVSYEQPSKETVYMVGGAPPRGRMNLSGMETCLAACGSALCCCCLWDMLT